MKTVRYTFIILLGILLTFIMLMFEFSIWIIYPCVVILFLLFVVVPQLYTLYKSNNLKKIERYLEDNKRKVLFAYPLAIKTGDHDLIVQAIQAILDKYKQPYMQEVYKTNLALFEDDLAKTNHLAQQISKEPLRTYYLVYVEALKGNIEEARILKENLPAGWMQHAIEAIIAKEQGDTKSFHQEAKLSIASARGIQKFTLLYSFENMKNS